MINRLISLLILILLKITDRSEKFAEKADNAENETCPVLISLKFAWPLVEKILFARLSVTYITFVDAPTDE